MRALLIAFEPFAERQSNGSQAVAQELKRRFPRSVQIRVLPVTWAAVGALQPSDLVGYDWVIGMGEGFPHVVAVEELALRQMAGPPDMAGQQPPDGLLRGAGGRRKLEVLGLLWRPLRSKKLSFPGTLLDYPTVAASSFPGYGQCNALLWRLLTDLDARKRSGFIHLPPRDSWMNDHPDGDYDKAFTNVVVRILKRGHIKLC